MNKVILMRRLTRDPEVRYTQGENAMAVDRRMSRSNQNGGQTADIIQCVRLTDKFGVRRLGFMAYDTDKESNANVLRQQDAIAQALMADGFSVELAHWSTKYGKGFDDLLAGGNVPSFELLGSHN